MTTEQYILNMQGNIFPALTVCALLALFSYGTGGLILKRRGIIAFSFGFALVGIVSFLFFPLPYSRITLQIAVGIASIFSLAGIYFLWKDFLQNKLLFASGAGLFIFLSASALLPPYAWDEQVYQIELLSRYLQNSSKAFIPDNSYSAWPGFLQFFLLPGYACGGLNVPRLFNSLLSVLLACSFVSVLRIYGRKNAFVLTCAVVLSPLFFILNRSVYAENTVALFLLAGFLSLYRLRKMPQKAHILAGIFAGIAVSVKLTAAGGAAALFFLVCTGKKQKRYLLLFIAGAVISALPFYLRVWLDTGNPVYPFLADVFNTSSAVENCHYQLGSARYGMGTLYGTVFGWLSVAFAGRIYDGVTSGLQHLVMLLIIFCGFCFRREIFRRKYIRNTLISLLIMYLFWGMTSQQSRFLFPGYFLLTFLCAVCLHKSGKKYQHLFLILLSCGILFTAELYPHIRHCFISWKILFPARKSPLRFIGFAQQDNEYVSLLEAIGKTPRSSKVLLLFEKRGLYVPRRHRIGDPGFQEKYFKVLPASLDDFLRGINDFDYILLGSGEKNVDFQENDIILRQKIHALCAAALAEGKLEVVLSGKSSHLLKRK